MVLASGSRTALILLLLLYFYIGVSIKSYSHVKVLYLLFVFFISIVILLNINYFSSKPQGLSLINSVRVDNLVSYVNSTNFLEFILGNGWGTNTSWHRFLSGEQDTLPPLDSFVAAMIYQIGIIGTILLYIVLGIVFSFAGSKGKFLYIMFVLIGGQINILEYYPISFMIFILVGLIIGINSCQAKGLEKINYE